MSRQLYCVGRVDSDGNYPILEKGFVYSFVNQLPISGETGSFPVGGITGNNNEFYATISNLPETTPYYIRCYAINALGISYSAHAITGITGGIVNKPTMTLKTIRKDSNLEVEAYEMGTNTEIVISGTTTPNDELTFTNLVISRTSSPPIANVRTWTGLKTTFKTDETPNPVSIYFTPTSTNPKSYTIVHNANYLCGNPAYTITATTQADAIYPYLWVLKTTSFIQTLMGTPLLAVAYAAGTHPYQENYFYYNASYFPIPGQTSLLHGKLVEKKKMVETSISMNTTTYRGLIFGYPKDHGSYIRIKINNGLWYTPSTNLVIVKTGELSQSVNIVNPWEKEYYIVSIPSLPQSDKTILYFTHNT